MNVSSESTDRSGSLREIQNIGKYVCEDFNLTTIDHEWDLDWDSRSSFIHDFSRIFTDNVLRTKFSQRCRHAVKGRQRCSLN